MAVRGGCTRPRKPWMEGPAVTDSICTVDGCDRPKYSRGWCHKHYRQWHRTGSPYPTMRPSNQSLEDTVAHVLAHAVEDNGCKIWIKGRTKHGYARIKFGGRMRLTHAVVAERYLGPCPPGLEVMHRCERGTDGCVTPDHLLHGTRRERFAPAPKYSAS